MKCIMNRRLVDLPVLLAFGLAALSLYPAAQAQPMVPARIDARMMRQPAVSATQIAFVYAGDIWLADKAGGEWRRHCEASGNTIARSVRRDGIREVLAGVVVGYGACAAEGCSAQY